MSVLESWVQSPGAEALVWTLIHSLWEGAVVALVLAGALCVLRGSRARYGAACLALLVLLAGFGVTFGRLMASERSQSFARTGPIRWVAVEADAGRPATLESPRGASRYLPWIAPFWIAGVLIFHVRTLAGWMGARRLRRTGICCAPAVWQAQLERLAARLGRSLHQ